MGRGGKTSRASLRPNPYQVCRGGSTLLWSTHLLAPTLPRRLAPGCVELGPVRQAMPVDRHPGVLEYLGSTGSCLLCPTRPPRAGDAVGRLSGPGPRRAMFCSHMAATAISVRRVEGPAVRVPPACAIFTELTCRRSGWGGKLARGLTLPGLPGGRTLLWSTHRLASPLIRQPAPGCVEVGPAQQASRPLARPPPPTRLFVCFIA